jgi:hypothetical protein
MRVTNSSSFTYTITKSQINDRKNRFIIAFQNVLHANCTITAIFSIGPSVLPLSILILIVGTLAVQLVPNKTYFVLGMIPNLITSICLSSSLSARAFSPIESPARWPKTIRLPFNFSSYIFIRSL